jgi:hypothetical protein
VHFSGTLKAPSVADKDFLDYSPLELKKYVLCPLGRAMGTRLRVEFPLKLECEIYSGSG